MTNQTFLNRIAQFLWDNYLNNNKEVVVVLPSKRSKIFLIKSLQNVSDSVFFTPKIISVEQFVEDISGLKALDKPDLLLKFYHSYLKVVPENQKEDFEMFSKWAGTLLNDFNEIDRYFIKPNKVFSYLKEIEALKRWNLEPNETTILIKKYLHFWNFLPTLYERFYNDLKNTFFGYQGMVYREAVNELDGFIKSQRDIKFVFAGFNALNKAEETIFQSLQHSGLAEIIWDADSHFLNDPYHDAGWFLRNIKKNWNHYKINPFEWITESFAKDKEIQIIGTPKSVGQARIVGDLISTIQLETQKLENTAIVLGDENLLIPVLHSLPSDLPSMNITMSFSGKSNPVQILIHKIFKMQLNAQKRNQNNPVFYHKEVLEVLKHPLLGNVFDVYRLVSQIKKNNISFLTYSKLTNLHLEKNSLFDLIFKPWKESAINTIENIAEILLQIRGFLKNEKEEQITIAFVHSLFKEVQKLIKYIEDHQEVLNLKSLYDLFKQTTENADVSFEGQPLEGLQIMGVLESRVLDFENVIITSVNEGTFPAGKSPQTFIPHDVKKELGLPTFKEKDAIYTYHFYNLIKRAKKVYLIYNTEAEGLEQGEKSRFITQLEVENLQNHRLTHTTYAAKVPGINVLPKKIVKTPLLIERLKEIAHTGFSPSSLVSYIRNPLQFYMQKVLSIGDLDQVEEQIAANTFGSIVHNTLEELYKPYLKTNLKVEYLQKMLSNIEKPLRDSFSKIYKDGEIDKGKNLLAYEVTKKYIQKFLEFEIEVLYSHKVMVIDLEQQFNVKVDHPELPYPVVLKGNLDRIDLFDQCLRIIDYKTGRVDKHQLSFNGFDELIVEPKKDKIFQLLCYAYMYYKEHKNIPEEACIYSFRNASLGMIPIYEGRNKMVINAETLIDFEKVLLKLIKEILDSETPFIEKLE